MAKAPVFPQVPLEPYFPVLRSIRVLASCGTRKWGPECNKGLSFLHNSGIGIALMSVTTNAKVKISPFVAQLATNPTFASGMSSSHSALCTALTTSMALCHGVADSLLSVCLGFSLIVMYDATGVRRHASMQAEGSDNFHTAKRAPNQAINFVYVGKIVLAFILIFVLGAILTLVLENVSN